MICPICEVGEVLGVVHVERASRFYPGHREVEVTDQTCACDLSDHTDDLFEGLAFDEWDAADAAYDRHEDERLSAFLGK